MFVFSVKCSMNERSRSYGLMSFNLINLNQQVLMCVTEPNEKLKRKYENPHNYKFLSKPIINYNSFVTFHVNINQLSLRYHNSPHFERMSRSILSSDFPLFKHRQTMTNSRNSMPKNPHTTVDRRSHY